MAQYPMQGRPGGPPLVAPPRAGTPKIVPIIVSMGVAVATFSGLYFGLGTGKDEAAVTDTDEGSENGSDTAPSTGSGSGSGSAVAAGSGSEAGSAAGSGSGSGSAVAAGSGSGSAAGAGSGSGSAAGAGAGSAATPEVKTATVTFAVSPAGANAAITVDGKKVSGGELEVELKGGKKVIKVAAKADGYHSFSQTVTVTDDTEVAIKLSKRSASSSSSSGSRPKPPHGPGNKIDL